jgi:hypothetical protein
VRNQRLFNEQAWLAVDKPSREAVIQFFHKRGIAFFNNPNQFGVDLLSPCGLTIEIEHREPFKETFPYNDCNIPIRKTKFLCGHPECSYCIVNCDYTRMGICDGETIQRYTDKQWTNYRGETFIQIPKEEFHWTQLN